MIFDEYSSSKSTVISSKGSNLFPSSSFLNKTLGGLTVSSNPSLRICVRRISNINSPRPLISNASLFSFSENVIPTLFCASTINLSLIWVLVNFLPSVPASGELFTVIFIDIVGGSIGVAWIGLSTSRSQIVSATFAFSKPATTTISPASPISIGTFFVPSYLNILVNLPSSTFSPSKFIALICWFAFAVPWDIRPTKLLPKKLSA